MNPSQPGGQSYQTPQPNQTTPSLTSPEPTAAVPDVNINLLEQITVRARHIVSQTSQDPRKQATELEQLKTEYIQKQYGLTIGKENV